MASFDTTRPAADGHLFGARFSRFVARFSGALATWNDTRVTRKALSRLSDHELDDLGLTRGDIDAISANKLR
ncbi:MAG: DUF1127 domain-containing protein [Rhodobacter sp.]|jgi:uncharacterized protein YjiS (DUF1127 family)|nr:DUF1127 domain-containing protein [Rhodobacter sp.]